MLPPTSRGRFPPLRGDPGGDPVVQLLQQPSGSLQVFLKLHLHTRQNETSLSTAETLHSPQARFLGGVVCRKLRSSTRRALRGVSHLADGCLPPPLAASTPSHSNDIIAGAMTGLFIPDCSRDVWRLMAARQVCVLRPPFTDACDKHHVFTTHRRSEGERRRRLPAVEAPSPQREDRGAHYEWTPLE